MGTLKQPMRNKILCETTLYDAGNIPYEGKSCIHVLLYEDILCMTSSDVLLYLRGFFEPPSGFT